MVNDTPPPTPPWPRHWQLSSEFATSFSCFLYPTFDARQFVTQDNLLISPNHVFPRSNRICSYQQSYGFALVESEVVYCTVPVLWL